jgi:hypothetical protein
MVGPDPTTSRDRKEALRPFSFFALPLLDPNRERVPSA